jgi:prefoldin subunit 5
MKINNWIKQIEKRKEAIAKERDKLDETISEMKELRESCDEAWQLLDDARDVLSQFV